MYKTARRPTANYNRKKTATAINYNRKKTATANKTLPTTSQCTAVHNFKFSTLTRENY